MVVVVVVVVGSDDVIIKVGIGVEDSTERKEKQSWRSIQRSIGIGITVSGHKNRSNALQLVSQIFKSCLTDRQTESNGPF